MFLRRMDGSGEIQKVRLCLKKKFGHSKISLVEAICGGPSTTDEKSRQTLERLRSLEVIHHEDIRKMNLLHHSCKVSDQHFSLNNLRCGPTDNENEGGFNSLFDWDHSLVTIISSQEDM